jgi:hypothetical protein
MQLAAIWRQHDDAGRTKQPKVSSQQVLVSTPMNDQLL